VQAALLAGLLAMAEQRCNVALLAHVSAGIHIFFFKKKSMGKKVNVLGTDFCRCDVALLAHVSAKKKIGIYSGPWRDRLWADFGTHSEKYSVL